MGTRLSTSQRRRPFERELLVQPRSETSAQNIAAAGVASDHRSTTRQLIAGLPGKCRGSSTRVQAEIGDGESDRDPSFAQLSLKLQHHNLRIRPEPQRRSPRSCAARSEYLHLPYPAQAVHKLPIDPARNPAPGNELAKMGMTRKLQRNSGCFGNFRIVGRVRHQNTRTVAIERDPVQRGFESPRLRRVPIMHACDLQAIDFDLFVIEYSHASCRNCTEIIAVVTELLMISCYEINTVRGAGQLTERRCRLCCVDRSAIV